MAGVESKIVEEKPKDARPAIDREKVRIDKKLKKIQTCLKSIKIFRLVLCCFEYSALHPVVIMLWVNLLMETHHLMNFRFIPGWMRV